MVRARVTCLVRVFLMALSLRGVFCFRKVTPPPSALLSPAVNVDAREMSRAYLAHGRFTSVDLTALLLIVYVIIREEAY